MDNVRICKKCLIGDISDENAAKAVRNFVDSIPGDRRTSEKEYKNRLAICRECDSLINGTCIKCGCYVEARAAGKYAECPDCVNRWSVTYGV